MSIQLSSHVFAGNPIISKTPKLTDSVSFSSAFQTLKAYFSSDHGTQDSCPNFKVLPFRKGRPLVGSSGDSVPIWHLGWLSLSDCQAFLGKSKAELTENSFVYLGSELADEVVFWAIDVSDAGDLENELSSMQLSFVDVMSLMVATDWTNQLVMADLAIAGQAKALLEWHITSCFCGKCGEKTVPIDAGRRKQCSNESCKKRIYPRVDPVVIMLVVDKQRDRALLSRQSKFVPRMWSTLAGFIEPGESLEEAVKRETWEETGIEVGEVIYHSSQPWPVGPSSMPCQLMVGFLAYAKSFEINVDKNELEDAQWFSREDVKKALTFAEYEKAQTTTAVKVKQMSKGVEKSFNLSLDFNMESGELASMFIPGPYAVAHHLIASWVDEAGVNDIRGHN
ncbi:hypothetical protein ACET3Z_009362 [Daucus carota]